MIYLDHNATTAPAPQAVQEMLDALQQVWANPSSVHGPGQAARRLLADARARVASLLGCLPTELVFTSGATESNHLAVMGALERGRPLGRHRLVMSAVEHPGLLAMAQRLRCQGTPVDLIGVDANGQLDLPALQAALGSDVALLSVMAANNETGVLMHSPALAEMAHGHGVPLHMDATQLVGKSTLRFEPCGADLWSLSAHKLHGPKGVGALVLRKGLQWPAASSGRQERGRRGGTENMPGIVGFAAAADVCAASLAQDLAHQQALRDSLEAGLLALHPAVVVVAQGAARLPNTVCVRFGELPAEQVLGKLERAGVVAASGAACSASGNQPSHVLLAMGASPTQALAGVRLSLGRGTQADDITQTLQALQRLVLPLLAAPSRATAQAA